MLRIPSCFIPMRLLTLKPRIEGGHLSFCSRCMTVYFAMMSCRCLVQCGCECLRCCDNGLGGDPDICRDATATAPCLPGTYSGDCKIYSTDKCGVQYSDQVSFDKFIDTPQSGCSIQWRLPKRLLAIALEAKCLSFCVFGAGKRGILRHPLPQRLASTAASAACS